MPSTPRNRGRTRRQASEDNIEEGVPTQRSRAEDVEDDDAQDEEEEQPRRVSKKSKGKPNKAVKKVRDLKKEKLRDEDDEEDDDGVQEVWNGTERPVIDVKNFEDQPLSRADVQKVVSLSNDWDQIIQNLRAASMELTINVGSAMAEAGMGKDGNAVTKDLEQVDAVMRELLDTQAELKAHQATLIEISNHIAQGEEVANVIARYKQGVQDRLEIWTAKTSRQKYVKDDDYLRFKSNIFEIQHPDQGMPPMTEFIEKEEGDVSDDEDIVVGGASQVYTCPLTLTMLEYPVTSQVCKHSFSRVAIEEYFQKNRSVRKKCPASGCNHEFGLNDVKHNSELERKVKAYQRRERQREAERDEDNDANIVIDDDDDE